MAAQYTNAQFVSLSAVTAGVKELRAAVDAAQHLLDHRQRATVLFIDEVHHVNYRLPGAQRAEVAASPDSTRTARWATE